jgi:hypothetical protein
MFRLALFSLLFVTASANLFTADEIERRLQDFDVDSFQFNFAGTTLNAQVASEMCPTQWQGMVQCVISDCPGFMDVCPTMEVPEEMQEFVGTAGKFFLMHECSEIKCFFLDAIQNLPPFRLLIPILAPGMGMNGTMGDTMPDMGNATAETLPEVPGCEEIESEFCAAFTSVDTEDCCLLDCAEAIKALLDCVLLETTGEDRSECRIPECETGGGEETAGSTETASTTSGASVIPKATAVAAGFAFALL